MLFHVQLSIVFPKEKIIADVSKGEAGTDMQALHVDGPEWPKPIGRLRRAAAKAWEQPRPGRPAMARRRSVSAREVATHDMGAALEEKGGEAERELTRRHDGEGAMDGGGPDRRARKGGRGAVGCGEHGRGRGAARGGQRRRREATGGGRGGSGSCGAVEVAFWWWIEEMELWMACGEWQRSRRRWLHSAVVATAVVVAGRSAERRPHKGIHGGDGVFGVEEGSGVDAGVRSGLAKPVMVVARPEVDGGSSNRLPKATKVVAAQVSSGQGGSGVDESSGRGGVA